MCQRGRTFSLPPTPRNILGFQLSTFSFALSARSPDSAKIKAVKPLPPELFPIFFKLCGRRCLIVGAGTIGESRVASLREAEAQLRVVAPEARPQVQSWAKAGKIEWLTRPWEPGEPRRNVSGDRRHYFAGITRANLRRSAACFATWSTFPSFATSTPPRWCSAARCKSPFPPLARARPWQPAKTCFRARRDRGNEFRWRRGGGWRRIRE